MARATKRDVAISEAIGAVLSPSQINRLRAEGFDLPPEGLQALAPLVGTGRDLDVAAVRLAADRGYYTDRLREVVGRPADEKRAETMLETLSRTMLLAAGELANSGQNTLPGAAHTPDEEARTMAGAARLEAEDAFEGANSGEFEDMWAISAQIAADTAGPPEPDSETNSEKFVIGMRAVTDQLQLDVKWAAQVAPDELVTSVQLASAICQRTLQRLPFGEEDYWRIVAAAAPLVGAVVELFARATDQPPRTAGS